MLFRSRYYLNSTGMLESPLPSTTTLTSTATSIVTSTTTVVSTTTSAARTTAIRARSEWSQDGDPWRDDDNLELYYAVRTFALWHSLEELTDTARRLSRNIIRD